MAQFKLSWVPREHPLAPEVAVAFGDTASRLARRLLRLSPQRLAKLNGIYSEELLAIQGEPDELPWVPDLVYLGKDPDLPGYFLPTAWRPKTTTSLLAGALRKSGLTLPAALLYQPPCRFSLGAARPIDTRVLERWVQP